MRVPGFRGFRGFRPPGVVLVKRERLPRESPRTSGPGSDFAARRSPWLNGHAHPEAASAWTWPRRRGHATQAEHNNLGGMPTSAWAWATFITPPPVGHGHVPVAMPPSQGGVIGDGSLSFWNRADSGKGIVLDRDSHTDHP
jgi:hypothetical protein